MASEVNLKGAGTHGTGIDLKSAHRAFPFLDSMKKAVSSQLINPDPGRVAVPASKIEKQVTHEKRDSDNEQSLDATSETDSESDAESCSQRAEDCFNTAAKKQPAGNPADHWRF